MSADRVWVVALEANVTGVKKRIMEGYLRDVAQIFSGVGANDPHLDVLDKIKFCLSRQLHHRW